MDLLDVLKAVDKSCEFAETKNYYYENHDCTSTGGVVKVQLDYKLSEETNDKILRFGKCKQCGKYFYHYDFESTNTF